MVLSYLDSLYFYNHRITGTHMKNKNFTKVIPIIFMAVLLSSCSNVATTKNIEVENASSTTSISQKTDFNDIQCNDILGQVLNGYRIANFIEEYRVQNTQEIFDNFYIWDSNAVSLDELNNQVATATKFKKIVTSSSCASYKVIFEPNSDFSIYMGSSHVGGTLQKTREKESRDWEPIYISSDSKYWNNLRTVSTNGTIYF